MGKARCFLDAALGVGHQTISEEVKVHPAGLKPPLKELEAAVRKVKDFPRLHAAVMFLCEWIGFYGAIPMQGNRK